ncbi:MAG: thiolase family protein [Acidobacteriota bacterium]|nr:thiolase family protein [Acidobacteriota bacterium]
MLNKPLFIASYHQSKFGKLKTMTVPEIVSNAVVGTCTEIDCEPGAIDVGSIASACGFTLNDQGLLSGLMAMVSGLEGKPMESVENACASGGQAVLSVAHKLLLGLGDVGIAVGFEKMRNDEGKMDGKRIGRALGVFSHPDEREGKAYIFPHLFAEVMQLYMDTHGVSEEDLARIAVAEYGHATHNPNAQMSRVDLTLEQATTIEGINRYIVDGLPLKTYDCSQITDGYAGLILATEEGLAKLGVAKQECVELAGFAQATDPIQKEGRDVLRPAGALGAMNTAYEAAGVTPADVTVAEVHDCFTVMGAIGVEVIGKAGYGEGAEFWKECRASVHGDCAVNTSGGLIAKGHPIGATGVAMIGWAAKQLLGQAPTELQRQDAEVAATFNIGGPICASVCTVLKQVA